MKKPAIITLSPEQYWKFRAEESDRLRSQERAENVLRHIHDARERACISLGLNPSMNYRFDDATQTISEVDIPEAPTS